MTYNDEKVGDFSVQKPLPYVTKTIYVSQSEAAEIRLTADGLVYFASPPNHSLGIKLDYLRQVFTAMEQALREHL